MVRGFTQFCRFDSAVLITLFRHCPFILSAATAKLVDFHCILDKSSQACLMTLLDDTVTDPNKLKYQRARPVRGLTNFISSFKLEEFEGRGAASVSTTCEETEAFNNRSDSMDAQRSNMVEGILDALRKLLHDDFEHLRCAVVREVVVPQEISASNSHDSNPSALTGTTGQSA